MLVLFVLSTKPKAFMRNDIPIIGNNPIINSYIHIEVC